MGRTHLDCYSRNSAARVVAICDADSERFQQEWVQPLVKSGVRTFTDYHELARDPEIDLIDVCAPTPLHAPATIESLNNGKNVICEKPMAFDSGECWAMEQAVHRSGKHLVVAHCLRYWPQYVQAHAMMKSGEYGRPLYASFHRSGAVPGSSTREWMTKADQSGGAVLDMHIHDVDAALWWFGKPASVHATGLSICGLPSIVDAYWKYLDGPVVLLHGSWDPHGGGFRYAFKLVLELATIVCDSNIDGARLKLYRDGKVEDVKTSDKSAYQSEIDDLIECLSEGREVERITPADARLAVETAREELRQIGAHV
jgi:predicted dehydrogenase